MDERRRKWIAHVKEVESEMDALAQGLEAYGFRVMRVERHFVDELCYKAKLQNDGAVTTVKVRFKDYDTDSEVVLTNITTLPRGQIGKGFGSLAVQKILQWATDNNLNEVRATQVGSEEVEEFWAKNGFRKCDPPNPCNDFVYVIKKEPRSELIRPRVGSSLPHPNA